MYMCNTFYVYFSDTQFDRIFAISGSLAEKHEHHAIKTSSQPKGYYNSN